jgi:glycosyltransferase involved in cell wall biosynthesis
MIRVLHTIDTTGPGGAETVFVHLATGLDKQQFISIAAIHGPGWVCDTLRKNGMEPLFIKSSGGFNLGYLRELMEIVRKYNIDIIQSHLMGSNLYCSMAGFLCRVPTVSTFHGFVDTSNKERLSFLKRILINIGSANIIFVSEHLKNYFVKNLYFSSSKAGTIYNGVDTSIFYPKKDDSIRRHLGIESSNIVIGAVGNIRPTKGYDIFLKAARLIHEAVPESRFIVSGQASGSLYKKLLQLRKDLGIENFFHFIGFQHDIAKVLNNFDIFTLPSISEGFSISTIEAMACGIPVVVTRSGGPEEIISDNISGLVVNANDFISLSNGILKLIKSPNFRQITIKSAIEFVKNNYTNDLMINNYLNLYKNLS